MEIWLGVGLHVWCSVAKDLKHFKEQKCARKVFSYNTLQYTYRTLQFIVFLRLSNLNKTSNRAVTHTSYKIHENWCVLLKSDMHVRPRTYARGVWFTSPPLRLIFYKNFIILAKEINCFGILVACLYVDLMQMPRNKFKWKFQGTL